MLCECCSERKLTTRTRVTKAYSREFRAELCDTCVQGHTREFCLMCGAGVWYCARVAHFDDVHKSVIEKFRNDPFPELEGETSGLKKIGTLRW